MGPYTVFFVTAHGPSLVRGARKNTLNEARVEANRLMQEGKAIRTEIRNFAGKVVQDTYLSQVPARLTPQERSLWSKIVDL